MYSVCNTGAAPGTVHTPSLSFHCFPQLTIDTHTEREEKAAREEEEKKRKEEEADKADTVEIDNKDVEEEGKELPESNNAENGQNVCFFCFESGYGYP